jgi:hypothetical protein
MQECAEMRTLSKSVSATLFVLACVLGAPPVRAFEVWVTNQRLDKIHARDGDRLKELATIETGGDPRNFRFSPDHRRGDDSNLGAGSAAVVDAVALGGDPHGVTVRP